MHPRAKISDERGTTLVELITATAIGAVVLLALSSLIIVSLRESDRVAERTDANQRGRQVINQVVDQLHSACVAPQIAPIKAGSTGTELRFLHQTGSAVVPVPVESSIALVGTTLQQSEFPLVSGAGEAPSSWKFTPTAASTHPLMTHVSPTPPSTSIFTYYAYSAGQISPTPLTVPLNENALTAVKVGIELTANPLNTQVADPNAGANMQSSALLRLTPPSFNAGAANLPCQ
jgi:Tfp pilus assembly protein PilW